MITACRHNCLHLKPASFTYRSLGHVPVWDGRRGLSTLCRSHAVVVVESPTKAKKIQTFLGDNYTVLASYGHIRDLPPKEGSVRPDEDFALSWQVSKGAGPRMKEIEQAVMMADTVLLASDPDREGEAIAWHVEEVLKRKGLLKGKTLVGRIAFNEITQKAVLEAMQQPRQVSIPLVEAYMARRALDYLVGFSVSPLLWRKLQGAKSAGRVQSVALRMVCERENDIERFIPSEYWSIAVDLAAPSGEVFRAALTHANGKKVGKMGISSKARAQELEAQIINSSFKVEAVVVKSQQRQPPAPFITSSLQQEASRKLGFGGSRTMRAAQQLYEGAGTGEGLITYMRTDGLSLSPYAVTSIRSTIGDMYGDAFCPESPRLYKSRKKNAQEAHEAIRPTSASLHPSKLPSSMENDLTLLYELIWKRSMACQMSSATIQQVAVDLTNADGSIKLRATGSSVLFAGYLKAYDNLTLTESEKSEKSDESKSEESGTNKGGAADLLLKLKEEDAMALREVLPEQHFTRPPPRFNDATIVKSLEELGIGRPSTYASIISLLQDRGYIVRETGRSYKATSLGRVLYTFLSHYFAGYVDYSFTSNMEEKLDDVSGGRADWKGLMRDFWVPFHKTVEEVTPIGTKEVFDMLDEVLAPHFFPTPTTVENGSTGSSSLPDPRQCPKCASGRLNIKPSRFGAFIGCSNYSGEAEKEGCGYARPLEVVENLTDESGDVIFTDPGNRELGLHPTTGLMISAKNGPYGPYVEMTFPLPTVDVASTTVGEGDGEEVGGKVVKKKGRKAKVKELKAEVRRTSLPKGMILRTVTLEEAVTYLELPKNLGPHPEGGVPVIANVGKFGPYVGHDGVSSSIPKASGLTPHTVTLEQAVELLEKKRARVADQLARGIVPRTWGKKGKAAAKKLATDAEKATKKLALAADKKAKKAKKATTATATKTSATKAKATSKKSLASGEDSPKAPRPPNAYAYFVKREWAAAREESPAADGDSTAPTLSLKTMGPLISAKWKALSDAEKARFKELAVASSASASPVLTPTRRLLPTPDSTQAPRPPNAYAYFVKREWAAAREESPAADGDLTAPTLSLKTMGPLISAKWKALSDLEKARFKELAAASSASASPVQASTPRLLPPTRLYPHLMPTPDSTQAPRPPNAYAYFVKSEWAAARVQAPADLAATAGDSKAHTLSLKIMGPIISAKWKALSDVEKAKFKELAAASSA